MTCGAGGRFYQVKANGMVRDVFDASAISGLKGWMGVGHGQSALQFTTLVADEQSDIPLLEVRHMPRLSLSTSTLLTVSALLTYVPNTNRELGLICRTETSSTPLLSGSSLMPRLTGTSTPTRTLSSCSTSLPTISSKPESSGKFAHLVRFLMLIAELMRRISSLP